MIKIKNVYESSDLYIIGKMGFCGCQVFNVDTYEKIGKNFNISDKVLSIIKESFEKEKDEVITEEFLNSKKIKGKFKKHEYWPNIRVFVRFYNGIMPKIKHLNFDELETELIAKVLNDPSVTSKFRKKVFKKASLEYYQFNILITLLDPEYYDSIGVVKILDEIEWETRLDILKKSGLKYFDWFLSNENDSDIYDEMCKYFDPNIHQLEKFFLNSSIEGVKLLYKIQPAELLKIIRDKQVYSVLFELDPKFILDDAVFEDIDELITISKKELRDLYERINTK